MPTREVPDTRPADVVSAEHPHLLEIVTVDLKVVEVKYIMRRLTEHLKVIMTNAQDMTSPVDLRAHYQEQQRLLLNLIVTLQNALDGKPDDRADQAHT